MEPIARRTQVGRGLWLRWLLASTVGLVVGIIVGLAVGRPAWEAISEALHALLNHPTARAVAAALLGAAVGVVAGAFLGMAQWLVLRKVVSQLGRWAIASTVGFAVGFAVGSVVSEAVAETLEAAVAFPIAGVFVGIAQWLVLRGEVSQPGWWVLASSTGFAVAGAIYSAMAGVAIGALFGCSFCDELAFIGSNLALAAYGAITGGVLVWLLRQPGPETFS